MESRVVSPLFPIFLCFNCNASHLCSFSSAEGKLFFSWKKRDYDRSLVRRKSWYGRPDQKMPITCWKLGLPGQEVVSPRVSVQWKPDTASVVNRQSPPRTPITANMETFSASKFSLLLASLIGHGVFRQNDIILEPLKTIHNFEEMMSLSSFSFFWYF